jgi:predicted transcriptional regulator
MDAAPIGSPAPIIRRNARGWRVGECHHRAKLTDDDVRLIRELRAEFGLTYRVIAEKFECGKSTVERIVKNRCRKLWGQDC